MNEIINDINNLVSFEDSSITQAKPVSTALLNDLVLT